MFRSATHTGCVNRLPLRPVVKNRLDLVKDLFDTMLFLFDPLRD